MVGEVDNRLLAIKPPNNITRTPRSIESHHKYWKASELRSFLFFYAPIILKGILPENLFQHFMLLSEAIFILNSQTIDESQIERTGNMLRQFCSTLILTAQLYDQTWKKVHGIPGS